MNEPIYFLIPLAAGFFLRETVRLYVGLALFVGPLLLRLGVAGPATAPVVNGWLAYSITTGVLLLVGMGLSRLTQERSKGAARKAD